MPGCNAILRCGIGGVPAPELTECPPLKDPLTVRKNVYRVLLTRGRDGTVVFVPPEPRLDATFDRLRPAGFRNLEASR